MQRKSSREQVTGWQGSPSYQTSNDGHLTCKVLPRPIQRDDAKGVDKLISLSLKRSFNRFTTSSLKPGILNLLQAATIVARIRLRESP